MKIAEGYLIFPSISFSASGVAAAAESKRERDDDVQSVVSALPAGSAVPKRTNEDMQTLLSELDGMAGRTGARVIAAISECLLGWPQRRQSQPTSRTRTR